MREKPPVVPFTPEVDKLLPAGPCLLSLVKNVRDSQTVRGSIKYGSRLERLREQADREEWLGVLDAAIGDIEEYLEHLDDFNSRCLEEDEAEVRRVETESKRLAAAREYGLMSV